ncbi:hypothetical protein AcV5_005335 [Taiwanofungus camphoratus]|nr:hypothetical protein AcV5_005335 [Antrodia cinnamomea]
MDAPPTDILPVGALAQQESPADGQVEVESASNNIPLDSTQTDLTALDGLEPQPNIIAHTVEPPPGPSNSTETQLALKDPDVKDVGWNRDPAQLPPTLVHGLSNDDLFALIRRFNKQIYHVKAIPPPPQGQLDLDISKDEEFSPDKLRAHLERLYMTVLVDIAAFAKHIARVRSWNEPRRTAWFCIAYYVAWLSNLLGALLSTTFLVLILHPPSRHFLFPPAPLAAVSASTGNLQVPRAGTIGSEDSLSGAPEAHKGEAVEQEASNFVTGVASLAVGTATGQKSAPPTRDAEAAEKDEEEDSGVGAALPDPTSMAAATVDAKHVAHGGRADGKHDATKTHVETAIWEKARPVMRALADITDVWERFSNALSPTPPFSHIPRLRLAGLLLPIIIAVTVFHSAVFVKGATFCIGFALFGQPVITRGAHWLTHRYPNWREMLELRRSILKGVPTNAQLTITLLRMAEASKTPLPPPPSTNKPLKTPHKHPKGSAAAVKEHDFEFDTSNYEVEGVGHHEEKTSAGHGIDEKSPKPKSGGKFARFIKGTSRLAVGGALNLDHVKAMVGSETAKRRLGAAPDPDTTIQGSRAGVGDGPTAYEARFHGKRGHVLLVTGAAQPFVSFVWDKNLSRNLASAVVASAGTGAGGAEAPPAVFTIALADIRGLRKVGGYGWKGKLIIGWALQRGVLDGIEIEDANGETKILTAIKGRDEFFDRLIAMGGHSWECW